MFQFGGSKLRKESVLLIVVAASLASLGASSPKLAYSWKNPNYASGTFKNIMVLALNGKAANRAEFEDELVAALARPGETVSPSYEFIPRPDGTPIDVKDIRNVIQGQNFDAVVVARLTKRDVKTTYVPGQVYTPLPYYGTFYGYYGAVYPMVYSPGYMQTERQSQVEVNFYSTAKTDGELVWTGTTNVFSSSSAMKVIKSLVKIVTQQLEADNVIGPGGS
jgi:hypothetical protein